VASWRWAQWSGSIAVPDMQIETVVEDPRPRPQAELTGLLSANRHPRSGRLTRP